MKDKILGFLGLGAMGFPMCYGLCKAGYSMLLPCYRQSALRRGFSPLAPDAETKAARMEEMIASGAIPASSQAALIAGSDVILLALPTSRQVEAVVLGEDGILAHARSGTIVIDFTSAEPASTRKLAAALLEKDVHLLDAPVSGGTTGASKQTLSIMAGGEEAVFHRCRSIFDVVGDRSKVFYMGPSGAGDAIKCANNFLSACCTLATAEALAVAARAGIDPRVANQVIACSGGKSDASMRKFPQKIFPGKSMTFALALMCKDLRIFTQMAQESGAPAMLAALTEQLWRLPLTDDGCDCIEVIHMLEQASGVTLCGIDGS